MANVSNPSRPKSEESTFPGQKKDFGQETSQGIADRAKEAASFASEKAKGAASSAMHTAENAASYVGQKAEDAACYVGSGLKSAADTVRSNAPGSGYMHDASEAVASSLDSAGRYLEEEGLAGIAEDMTAMIRRNPIPALLIAVGVGFLLARATAPRSNY